MPWTAPPHDRARELREQLSPELQRAAVEAACEAAGLPAADLAPFPTGSDVVWAAGAHVVKLSAPCWADEIAAEERLLRHVAGRLSLATPTPVASGRVDGWPFVVTTRVEGVALGEVWAGLERGERARLAGELGRATRELHELPTPCAPGGDDGWAAFWADCRAHVVARHARGDVPEALLAQVEPFLARFPDLDGGARATLHTELLDQHVLAAERGGRWELAALLDFADGRVGPPEYEFAAPVEFVFRGEPGLLRAYLRAYGEDEAALDDARPARLLAWALLHRFGSLARMLRAVGAPAPRDLDELARRLFGVAPA